MPTRSLMIKEVCSAVGKLCFCFEPFSECFFEFEKMVLHHLPLSMQMCDNYYGTTFSNEHHLCWILTP